MTELARHWARWSGWYWNLASLSAWLFLPVMNMALTPKQEMFCREYLVDLNLTQAAMRAGYSEKYANREASRLWSKVDIQNRINELKEERNQRTDITTDYVLQRLAEIDQMDVLCVGRKLMNMTALARLPNWWRWLTM